MTSADSVPHLPVRTASDGGKNFMMLTMLQNHENKTSEMVNLNFELHLNLSNNVYFRII